MRAQEEPLCNSQNIRESFKSTCTPSQELLERTWNQQGAQLLASEKHIGG